MNVEGTWRRAIELVDDDAVIVLDQTKLPHAIEWKRLATIEDVATAIRDMTVRGAPLIGATAAWGVALALAGGVELADACRLLAATRPTAVNLQWALARMRTLARPVGGPDDRTAPCRRLGMVDAAFALATKICDEDVDLCKSIGSHGVALLRELHAKHARTINVLTHCNAGWLATVDWGTALAPIYRAHQDGLPIHVWVDETRPRNQGLLTAWELAQHGVPHTLITDNAGGHLMQHGKVDLVIVGTDRTTRNGDVCNKIGTYLKALAAHDNGIPFYVAAPSPSIDFSLASGADVPIEERSGDELRHLVGRDASGATTRIAITARGTLVANPAFDVTPARLVTGIITERGIVAPDQLATLFSDRVLFRA